MTCYEPIGLAKAKLIRDIDDIINFVTSNFDDSKETYEKLYRMKDNVIAAIEEKENK